MPLSWRARNGFNNYGAKKRSVWGLDGRIEWGRARLNRRRFGMLQEVGQARPPQIFIAFPTELQFLSITSIHKQCGCAHHFLDKLICFNYGISATAKVPHHKLTLPETNEMVEKACGKRFMRKFARVRCDFTIKSSF